MLEFTHRTPCHCSPHGSPALAVHPGIAGDPRDVYRLFIAFTTSQ